MQDLRELVEEFFCATVSSITEESGEQGYSGGKVYYFRATVNGEQRRFVAKSATLIERRIMLLLSQQKQAVPRMVCRTDKKGRDWLVMEYADDIPYAHNESQAWSPKLGYALAKIHAANMGNRPEWLEQLPPQNPLSVIFADEWLEMYDQLLANNTEFRTRYGKCEMGLKESWKDFQRDFADELTHPQGHTLISTDLTPGHWRQIAGAPVLIDWEQSKFGPLYIDLPNMFNDKTIKDYYCALRTLDVSISADTFADKFVSLSRYLGFRYMTVGFSFWLGTNTPGQDYWRSSGAVFFEKCLQIAQTGYPRPELT